MDIVCRIRLADELDRKSVEVKYSVEVMKNAEYETFLRTKQLLTHPAFQVRYTSSSCILWDSLHGRQSRGVGCLL